VDARSDVYSLGVVLYEMLTGGRLFSVSSPERLRDAHLYETPVPLSGRCPGVPSELSAVIHRALAKAPQDRFATAAEFRAALDAQLGTSRGRRSPISKVVIATAITGLLVTVATVGVKWGTARIDAIAGRQLYDRGIRAQYASDSVGASQFFQAALRKDSTLAIAALAAAAYTRDSATWGRLMSTAVRHAREAPDRERLRILLHWARLSNDPTATSIADSLRIIDPRNPEGDLELGKSLASTGDFLASIPVFRRAITLDSAGFAGPVWNCSGCDAFERLTWTYFAVDSLEAGESAAREWIASSSRSYKPWFALAWSLAHRNLEREAIDAWRHATTLDPTAASSEYPDVQLRLFLEDYSVADRLLDSIARAGRESARVYALWWSIISLRSGATAGGASLCNTGVRTASMFTSRLLPSLGRSFSSMREAGIALLFEALTNANPAGASMPSVQARQRTWGLARAATAAASMKDTSALKLLADSIERVGRLSPLERDKRLHYYVRANVLMARGARAAAADEYRRAIESPTVGYTRINLELGRVLLLLGRAPEAAVITRAALHGQLESNNYYVTRTELHELLAQAPSRRCRATRRSLRERVGGVASR
jgi:tetratricopeptide (TPR) repeat protein